ncbi:MAG: hypothetical protein RIR18_2026 [Pseudomonadota bacterium]
MAAIVPADIEAVLSPLSDRGVTRTALKVLQMLKRFFNFAIKKHLITSNPAAPYNSTDINGKAGPRRRVLSADDEAMRSTPNFPPHVSSAIKLLLALAVRKSELVQAKWTEFDLDNAVWHIPTDRTKTESAIRIPLSNWALEVLNEQKAKSFNDYVFPMIRKSPGKVTEYMGDSTINHALYRLQSDLEPFTVHDLRRTARTHLAALGTPSHIAEMCLNHKPKGIESVYNVYDYFEERKASLRSLSNLFQSFESGNSGKIIPFKQSQKTA